LRYPEQRQTAYNDTPIRVSISVSPKVSEMSSTGRDSKVSMTVADAEVGHSTYHANQFLSHLCPTRPAGGSSAFRSFICFRLPRLNHQCIRSLDLVWTYRVWKWMVRVVMTVRNESGLETASESRSPAKPSHTLSLVIRPLLQSNILSPPIPRIRVTTRGTTPTHSIRNYLRAGGPISALISSVHLWPEFLASPLPRRLRIPRSTHLNFEM
jgi:hypothetical protein